MTDIIANSTDQNLPMLGRQNTVRHRALAGDSFKQLAERAEISVPKDGCCRTNNFSDCKWMCGRGLLFVENAHPGLSTLGGLRLAPVNKVDNGYRLFQNAWQYSSIKHWCQLTVSRLWMTCRCRRLSVRVSNYKLTEACALLGCYAACTGNSLPTFRKKLTGPIFRGEISKKRR